MSKKWVISFVLFLASPYWNCAQTCSHCAEWNQPQKPFRIYGNTYYVGPHGLTSLLITSDQGHILIDGAIAESAPQIAQHIRDLGFRVEDIKLILNSHVHHDHAGGIAELQRMSGARVVASYWSAQVLEKGGVAKDDPQHGDIRGIAPIANVTTLHDGELFRIGPIAIRAHYTPGHTPGGTSWTWTSCEAGKCLNMVYADSISAVSRPGWKFSKHPEAVVGFVHSFSFLKEVLCDILITPHPDASVFADRLNGKTGPDGEGSACRALAEQGRENLEQRLASENTPN